MRPKPLRSAVVILLVSFGLLASVLAQAPAGAAPSPAVPAGPIDSIVWARAATGPDSYVEMSDLSYGSAPQQVMDAYVPSHGSGPHPGVVVIHGGAWEAGSREDMAAEAEALAQSGFVALDVDYRLDGPSQPGFPTELSDVEAALAWARAHADLLDLDPGRMGAFGVSAGGSLGLQLADLGLVSAVVSWSAPTELAAFETSPYRPCTAAGCGSFSMPYAVYRYLGCLPQSCAGTYAAASPEDGVSGTHAAFMVWNSTHEIIPESQADGFVAAAQAAGAYAEEDLVAGDAHATGYGGQALAPSINFLLSRLA